MDFSIAYLWSLHPLFFDWSFWNISDMDHDFISLKTKFTCDMEINFFTSKPHASLLMLLNELDLYEVCEWSSSHSNRLSLPCSSAQNWSHPHGFEARKYTLRKSKYDGMFLMFAKVMALKSIRLLFHSFY